MKSRTIGWACAAAVFVWAFPLILVSATRPQAEAGVEIKLPTPRTEGGMALSQALATRRSQRSFESKPLSAEQIAQLCWAAQGITEEKAGLRTAPSALKLFGVRVYVVDAAAGFEYVPQSHSLRRLEGEEAPQRMRAVLGNAALRAVPVIMVIAVEPARLQARCGEKSERFCLLEAGAVCQNVLLQATALGLANVPVGGVDEAKTAEALRLPNGVRPVYAIPVGYPAK